MFTSPDTDTKAVSLSSDSISDSVGRVQPAAIWARVSTNDQRETSLPSQLYRCKELLDTKGYSVIHTFQVDWSSMDLYACPEFQQLRNLIRSRDIRALATYDRDRLEAKGLQRLVFLSELKENDVELLVCSGPPIFDGPEGQLIEHVLAISKERQVLRARQGSKDGLHDRAVKYGKPVTYHRLYGYSWDKENNRLLPNDDWPSLKLIFDMALGGSSYYPIIQELKKRGISSPSGQPEWNKTALSSIFHNPAYAGRYYALKKVAVEPMNRRGNSYGNSSVRKVSLSDSHYMPHIEVVNPPITWEQRELILNQLARHQKLSRRNAKRDYLLRGMILCETHRGKNGKPRRYHGIPKNKLWAYTCPVGGCRLAYINGPKIEEFTKSVVIGLFMLEEKGALYKELFNVDNIRKTKKDLEIELQSLSLKNEKLIDRLVKLEERYIASEVDKDVHQRLKKKIEAERQWIKDRQAEISSALAQLHRRDEAITSIEDLRLKFANRLVDMDIKDWRELLTRLDFQIHVPEKLDEKLADEWLRPGQFVASELGFVFSFNIPLDKSKLKEIMHASSIGPSVAPARIRDTIQKASKDIVLDGPELG